MIVAFAVRFVFAYGVSAGNDFALSGGSVASNHLHIIESILNGSYSLTDSATNYPYGSINAYPPLLDYLLAGVASVATAAGISTSTAAAGVLAFSTPIFATATCLPVYLVGRKMFDERTGLLAALFYALFALAIMSSVFSNGTEFAFIGFLFAFMVYALLIVVKRIDETQPKGFSALSDRKTLIYTAAVGVILGLIGLSWGQFRILILVLAFIMFAQAVVDRVRSKEVAPMVTVYSVILLLGVVIPALYYVPAGLWSQIISGPFVIGVLAALLATVFAATSGRPWVITAPLIVIAAVAVLVITSFLSNDLYSAVVHGNTVVQNPLVNDLVSSSRHTSISSMAAYYGWLTLWLPALMFLYMLLKYRDNADSKKYAFVMWWLLAMFAIGWYSSSYAIIAAAGFAVGSAAAVVMILKTVHAKDYVSGLRGNGIKAGFRKMLKPMPFAAVVAIVVLIAAPNLVYAMDASTPTNSDGSNGYFGGLGYTVQTDDANLTNGLWHHYGNLSKTGALASWFGYSNDALSPGGFSTVADANGNGASAVSNMMLAKDGPTAVAAMATRLIVADGVERYRSAISDAGMSYDQIAGYVNNPESAVKEIKDNIDKYPGISPEVTEENAVYLAVTSYITSSLVDSDINRFYGSVCARGGHSISYIEADASLLPLYYNDGSPFSTIAYLGSYSTDGYGAPTQFFSYQMYNSYSGTVSYTDAMYDTFIWRALIGPSPAQAGYTNYSEFLNALALSDGSIKSMPGYGLSGFKIAYWHVQYNSDDDATTSSEGWTDMDAYDAIALQKNEGGLINYVSSVVLLEFDPGSTKSLSGTINYQSHSGPARAEGITVSVYTKPLYDTSKYVLKTAVTTKANGNFTVAVPDDGTPYYITISSGDTLIDTYRSASDVPTIINLPATGLKGTIGVGSGNYTEPAYVVLKAKASGHTEQVDTVAGSFTFVNIMPDTYDLTVYSKSGTVIKQTIVPVIAGGNDEIRISATTAKVSVNATDDHGEALKTGTAVATDNESGLRFSAPLTDGKVDLDVVPGTYAISVTGPKVSVSTATVTVENTGSKSANVTAYDAKNVNVTGVPAGSLISLMAQGFVASSTTGSFQVPITGGINTGRYTAYAVNGNTVYSGTSTGSSITVAAHTGYDVTGTLNNKDNENITGTVTFYGGDGAAYVFSADEDGKFSAFLPAGGYTMHIAASGNALVKSVDVSGNTDLGTIKTEKSRNVVLTLTYTTNMSSGSTRALAFVDINFTISIDAVDYLLTMKTDTTGKATFVVPQGPGGELKAEAFDTAQFHMDEQTSNVGSGSSNSSMTWSLDGNPGTGSTRYVKNVNVTSPYPAELTLYNDSSKVYNVSSASTGILPGQYTVKIAGSTGHYYSGSVYVYPGHTGALDINAPSTVKVTLNASSADEITVTPTDKPDAAGNDQEGSYREDPENPLVYYVEAGKSYLFQAVSGTGDSETIAYANVNSASGSPTLDLSNKAKKVVVTGYVGAVADGELTVVIGSATITANITNGAFEITVPEGRDLTLSAAVAKTVDTTKYAYAGSVSVPGSQVTEDAAIHFPVLTTGSESTLDLSGSGFSFSGGRGTFTLTVKNTGDYKTSYSVTAGNGWRLDRTYTVVVDANSSTGVVVSGTYDSSIIGAGDSRLSVAVAALDGNSLGSYIVDGAAISPSGTTDTYVNLAGTDGASPDALTGYEYMYAVTVKNNDNWQKSVTLNAAFSGPHNDWTLVVCDGDSARILASGAAFLVNGYGSTTLYVKAMYKYTNSGDVPAISMTLSAPGLTLKTDTGSVSVSGGVATASLSTNSASVETVDNSVSGDNIYNDGSEIPATFLAVFIACVLVLLFTIWAGMKRGVFVRKK
jgi:asparagine N-glycosylation enzyme membrane subunit Stt3